MKKSNIKNKGEKKDFRHKKNENILIFKAEKMKKYISIFSLFCLLLFILIIILAVRTYNHYNELKEHRDYFKQPNASIQDWMTIHSVVYNYNISESQIYFALNIEPGTFGRELGIDNSTTIDRLTIKAICMKKHLDCNDVVSKLNKLGTK
jgi:hypothetical protein